MEFNRAGARADLLGFMAEGEANIETRYRRSFNSHPTRCTMLYQIRLNGINAEGESQKAKYIYK